MKNKITPAWLVDALPDVIGGTGYNTQMTHLLVVDDFSSSISHGVKVKQTIMNLINAVAAAEGVTPNIVVHEVDISNVKLASDIATIIGTAVEGIRDASEGGALNFVVNMSFGLTPCDDPGGEEVFDAETGETFITPAFSFDQFSQGIPEERPFERVSPVLECVVVHYKDESSERGKSGWSPWGHKKKNIKGYTAYFGYNNPNLYPVEIPIGKENRFHPFPQDRGQPTVFAPGRQRAVFALDYQYGFVKWRIGHKWAMAWLKSPICDDNEPPEMSLGIIREGYSLTEYAQEQLGLKEEYVDDYYKHLFTKVQETETEPFKNIQKLMQMYLEESAASTNFSFVPVASAGNFAYLLGTEPLKPAAYPEVVGVSATVGDFGPIWRLSHSGDIRSPGVSVALAFEDPGNPESPVTEIGSGTSHAAPYTSVLYGLWLTYPNACDFNPSGLPPLIDSVLANRNQNEIFTGIETPLDCSYNLPPELVVTSGGTIDENTSTIMGTVSDPNGDAIDSMQVDNERFSIDFYEIGEGEETEISGLVWTLKASDNFDPDGSEGPEIEEPETIFVTATDSRGASTTIEVTVTVKNVPPTATLLVNSNSEVSEVTINAGESITMAFIEQSDQSDVDEAAGFTYRFVCEYEWEGEGEYYEESEYDPTLSTKTCTYPYEGEYWATATIFDKDGGFQTEDVIITVEPVAAVVCYADYVVSYEPGRRNDGKKINANRRNPANALGAPQNTDELNFVSLGFPYESEYEGEYHEASEDEHDEEYGLLAGSIILGFNQPILNNNGAEPDVRIWETSYGTRPWSKYPEVAIIYASIDGITWGDPIGITTDKDQAYDLGESLPYANFIKLVDATNPSKFSGSADGFDVDGVEGFDCGYIEG